MASFLEKSCKDDDEEEDGGIAAPMEVRRATEGISRYAGGGPRSATLQESGGVPPVGGYLVARFSCLYCAKEVLVYCWLDWPQKPPEPIPWTIERGDRRSRVRDCWFNFCSYCERHFKPSELRGLAWRLRTGQEDAEARVLLPGDVLLDGAPFKQSGAGGGQ
jgi:hypothetical protein